MYIILNFTNISPVGAELYYVGGRTDRRVKQEKLEVALRDSLAKVPKMDNSITLNHYDTFIT
jgi:hypothetical protein